MSQRHRIIEAFNRLNGVPEEYSAAVELAKNILSDSGYRPVKQRFKWVAEACGKTPTKPWMQYVYVSGGQMYASDGCRMHWATTNMEDGIYDKKENFVRERLDDMEFRFLDSFKTQIYFANQAAENKSKTVNLHEMRVDLSIDEFVYRHPNCTVSKRFMDAAVNQDTFFGEVLLFGDRIFGNNDLGFFIIATMR